MTGDNQLYIQEKYLRIDIKLMFNIIQSKQIKIVKQSMNIFYINLYILYINFILN